MQDFVHIKVHSEYSILNSIAKLDALIEKTIHSNMKFIGLTDISNMFACYTFEKMCKSKSKSNPENSIKNLIGVTFCVKGVYEPSFYTVTLIAKSVNGYRNIANLSTIANTGHDTFPCISFDDLLTYSDDCICLTGGNSGEFFKLVLTEQYEKANEYIGNLVSAFSNQNVYIELNHHFIPDEEKFLKNPILLEIAERFNIDFVATNNIYYLEKENSFHRAIALEMNPNPEGIDIYSKYVNYNDEFYFKTIEEMNIAFQDYFAIYPNIFKNTLEIAKQCSDVHVPIERALPAFPLPEGFTSADYLKKLVWEGFKKKFPTDTYFATGFSRKDYEERLNYEYETIVKMGFTDYFLIVQDFINFAKDKEVFQHPEIYFPKNHYELEKISEKLLKKDYEIYVGPGRGSAAGSLMAYCLQITERLDPIKNKLLFERFLNVERVSMPDIDIDFSNAGRYDVVQYVQEKYQYSHVAQIVTFQTMQARKIIRAVGKTIGLTNYSCNEIAQQVPLSIKNEDGTETEVTSLSQLEDIEFFRTKLAESSDVRKLFSIGKVLEGLPSSTGKHAAGLIIGCKELKNYLPLMEVDGVMVTQFEKGNCEEIGLLKMDLLGLRTLDILQKTSELIKKVLGIEIPHNSIPEEDALTFDLLRSGNTRKVFQIESDGMISLFKKMKPSTFEDINAAIALYRPGPMEFIPKYLEGRAHPELIQYPHPLFKEVTEATYGILVYQEQIMQVVQKLAGFTLGHADILRKAISKKKKDTVAQEKKLFIDGCLKVNHIPEKESEKIFEQIEPFANYGFNRSHSAAYGIVAYDTAYFKAHFPECFMAANLTISANDGDDVAYIIAECKKNNIQILPPDVDKSSDEFLVEKMPDGTLAIRYAYSAISGIGENMAYEYAKISNSSSLGDFISKIPTNMLRTAQLSNLIHSGAFDRFGSRRAMIQSLPGIIQFFKTKNTFDSISLPNFLDYLSFRKKYEGYEFSQIQKLEYERKAINVSLSGHPLEVIRSFISKKDATLADILFNASELNNSTCTILCLIKDIKVIQSRKGSNMAFLQIEDEFQVVEGILFPHDYQKVESDLEKLKNIPVLLTAKLQTKTAEDDESLKCALIVTSIEKAIKNEYRLYLDEQSIKPTLLSECSQFNGIATVILVNTTTDSYTRLPYTMDLNEEILQVFQNNHVNYHICK